MGLDCHCAACIIIKQTWWKEEFSDMYCYRIDYEDDSIVSIENVAFTLDVTDGQLQRLISKGFEFIDYSINEHKKLTLKMRYDTSKITKIPVA